GETVAGGGTAGAAEAARAGAEVAGAALDAVAVAGVPCPACWAAAGSPNTSAQAAAVVRISMSVLVKSARDAGLDPPAKLPSEARAAESVSANALRAQASPVRRRTRRTSSDEERSRGAVRAAGGELRWERSDRHNMHFVEGWCLDGRGPRGQPRSGAA